MKRTTEVALEAGRAWQYRVGEVKIGMFEMIGWLIVWYYLRDVTAWALDKTAAGGFDKAECEWWRYAAVGLMALVTAAMLLYVRLGRRHRWGYLGFEKPHWRADVRFTALGALATGGVFALLLLGVLSVYWQAPELFYKYGLLPPPAAHARGDEPAMHVLWYLVGTKEFDWFSILSIALIFPVMEEIWFRGWMYPVVRRHFSAWVSISFVAVIFAFAHANTIPVSQLIGGFVFTYAYEKRPTLAVPITLHILGNTTLVVLSWLVQPPA